MTIIKLESKLGEFERAWRDLMIDMTTDGFSHSVPNRIVNRGVIRAGRQTRVRRSREPGGW
jgi:hypothetical protein